jgi:hypothetical protein
MPHGTVVVVVLAQTASKDTFCLTIDPQPFFQ